MPKNNNNDPKPNNNAKSTNERIQNQISSAGRTVDYKEASAVAQKLGVSVDRVYNQTAKTGQTARAGAAAANAGYLPSSQLKVGSPLVSTYAQQASINAQAQIDQANAAAAAAAGGGGGGYGSQAIPQFDWEAWNAQMMSQQAAIWESMDAMNAEFMTKQQEWLAQQSAIGGQQGRANAMASGVPADKATVKRKKRTAAATGLNTSSSNTSLSLGGGSAGGGGGLSIGGG
jgi:hypothetical protein